MNRCGANSTGLGAGGLEPSSLGEFGKSLLHRLCFLICDVSMGPSLLKKAKSLMKKKRGGT